MKDKRTIKNPKVKRDPVATRNHILDVAFKLIYRHGFKGTSTNQVIDQLECTRGAFFHHFPSKDELGYALIDDILYELIYSRWVQPLLTVEDKVEGICHNFYERIITHKDEDILCGCPLNNMVQEMADDSKFQHKIQGIMEMWVSETQKLLTQAKRSGQLKKDVDTRTLAEFIVAQEEAAFAMGKAFNNRSVMKSIYKSFSQYLYSLKEA